MSASIPPSTPGKPWQPPALEDLAPELPQYEILGLLGRGGMGAVYKARQKSLNRDVAIKVLPPAIEDGEMRYGERFISEAQSMAKLEHPDIVAVYDAGQTPGGLLYFVMQYVQGTDVAQMIAASGKLPPEHAYAITAHVCEALDYAHRHGIIHRDIKPANIMVDMEGRVKVADFGLAKAVDANTGFTQSDMAVGSPDFFAPESLTPGMSVDGRADLYAVGVMLYQMLTGKIPRGAWQPASVLSPGTDPRFDEIILKAMQYDPQERHSSASELRQHLDTLLLPAVPAPELQQYSSAQVRKTPPAKPQAAEPRAGRVRQNQGAPVSPSAKSKTPLFIGIAAAVVITIGAFAMVGGDKDTKQGSLPASASGMSLATASQPAHETERSTTPPSIKASEPAKPAPKPVVPTKVADAQAVPPKREWQMVAINPRDIALKEPLNDGWWHFAKGASQGRPEPIAKASEHVAVRYRLRVSPKTESVKIHLRREPGYDVSLKLEMTSPQSAVIWRDTKGADGKNASELARLVLLPKLRDGAEIAVEFATFGDTVVGRVDGKFIGPVKDSLLRGRYGFSLQATEGIVKDMEYMLLNDLSEAEAYAALGWPVPTPGSPAPRLPVAAPIAPPQPKTEAPVPPTPSSTISDLPTPAVKSPPLPPELSTLDNQFLKLQTERVTAPFEVDLAKLNTSYLAAVDREMAKEKAAGRLDGILALEAEKKLITGKQPIPETDDDKTLAPLKALRTTYRTTHTKLIATRAANLKALTDPLDKRLGQMESDFIKTDRVADAKAVRGYREVLAERRPVVAVTPEQSLRASGQGATPPKQTTSPSPAADPTAVRQAADWVLGLRGTLVLDTGGVQKSITDPTALPKGALDVRGVMIEALGAAEITDENIVRLSALKGLRSLKINGASKSNLTKLEALAGMKDMEILSIEWLPNSQGPGIADAELAYLSGMKNLTNLSLGVSGINGTGLAHVPQGLTHLGIARSVLSDEGIAALGSLRSLTYLGFDGTSGFTTENITPLRNLKGVTNTWAFPGIHELVGDWDNVTELTLSKGFEGSLPRGEVLAKLASFPKLHTFRTYGVEMTNEDILALSAATKLTVLLIQNGKSGSDGTVIATLPFAKNLSELALQGSPVTDAGLNAIVASCPGLTKLFIDLPNPLDKMKQRMFTATGLSQLSSLRDLWIRTQ